MLLDAVNRVQYFEEEVDDMCRSPKRPKLEIVDSCASGPPEKEGSPLLIRVLWTCFRATTISLSAQIIWITCPMSEQSAHSEAAHSETDKVAIWDSSSDLGLFQ